jgi:hypothetical protein
VPEKENDRAGKDGIAVEEKGVGMLVMIGAVVVLEAEADKDAIVVLQDPCAGGGGRGVGLKEILAGRDSAGVGAGRGKTGSDRVEVSGKLSSPVVKLNSPIAGEGGGP